MQLNEITNSEQLQCLFNENKGWDKQYRLIIQLGKLLDAVPEHLKIESNQVKGCESLAWLIILENKGSYHFLMDSDTRVVRGLMKVVSLIFQGKTKQQIELIDCSKVFTELGLLNHLSPSRTNGLFAIINKIQGVN